MLSDILPVIPPYEGLHPIVVHFPIALLIIAPLFIKLAAVWKSQSKAMMVSALLMLVLGTAFTFLAMNTGEATEHAIERWPGLGKLIHAHEDAAELARNLFVGYAVLVAIVTGLYWKYFDKVKTGLRYGVVIVMLVLWVGPGLSLVNAAHLGGELVHVHGVKAPMGGTTVPVVRPESAKPSDKAGEAEGH